MVDQMKRQKFIIAAIALFITPGPAFAQVAGFLSSAEPVLGTPPGSQAWRVRYWTTSVSGDPIEVTGMIAAPTEQSPTMPRRVLAWAHGTSGVVPRCAPSLADNFFEITPGLNEAIERGYTVVAPDYPGLGSNMPHAYLSGVGTGRSVLDLVRAARQLPAAAAGSRFAVWGESQGGHAALWTGQMASTYAPDLTLVGVAAAAPPTDLAENLEAGSDPSVRAFLTAFTAYSWSQSYGADLSTLGRRSTQRVITRLARNNCVKLGASPRLGTALGVMVLRRDLKNVDLGKIEPWARIARENSPTARPYGVPFLIAQNPDDVIVAPAITRAFAQRLCMNGASVRYLSIIGQGHQTSARDTTEETLDWVGERFAGTRAPSDCEAL